MSCTREHNHTFISRITFHFTLLMCTQMNMHILQLVLCGGGGCAWLYFYVVVILQTLVVYICSTYLLFSTPLCKLHSSTAIIYSISMWLLHYYEDPVYKQLGIRYTLDILRQILLSQLTGGKSSLEISPGTPYHAVNTSTLRQCLA